MSMFYYSMQYDAFVYFLFTPEEYIRHPGASKEIRLPQRKTGIQVPLNEVTEEREKLTSTALSSCSHATRPSRCFFLALKGMVFFRMES
jgi:hypothetical protein